MRNVKKLLYALIMGIFVHSSVLGAVWEVSPWEDDASTGIDSSKVYTHAINMSYDTAPTVNGVPFALCWGDFANGSLNGGNWVDSDEDNNISGDSYELGRDFRYSNTLMVLSGLTPGGVYELTLFSTGWEDDGREVTLTDQISTFVFNQDEYGLNNGIKIVGIYTADDNGEFRLSTVESFHIYAFANCEYSGKLPAVVHPTAPDEFKGGNRVPVDTVLSWEEEFAGSLADPVFDVYFDPNESKVTALDPTVLVSSKQFGFSYTPDLDPNAVYYWRVATYLDSADSDPNMVSVLSSFRTVYEDEHWSGEGWTSDADIQVSPGKVYTHKVNFNSGQAATTNINSVKFENDSDRLGSNWMLAGASHAAGGYGHNVNGDGSQLVDSMFYVEPTALTLTGLIPGQEYVYTEYVIAWGDTSRPANISTSADGRVTELNQLIAGDGNGYLFKYSYIAPDSGELTLTYDSLRVDQWHHYAFSNEEYMPVYVDPTPVPGSNMAAEVELSWVPHGDVVNPVYNLMVSTDPDMTNIVLDRAGLSATFYTVYLNSDTQYYWQLEIVEDGSAVVYSSPIWDFITSPPQDADIVIEWKFNEVSGDIAEQTGPTEDADGKLVGFNDPNTPGVSHVAGLIDNGLLFNGKDEYIDVSDAHVYMPTADGQAFAVSGYIQTFFEYGPLFSMRNSEDGNPLIDIALGDDGVQDLPGQVCLLVRDDLGSINWTSSGVKVNDGRWHNFIVTRISGIWTLYIDGQLCGVIKGAATGNVDLNLLSIGTSLRWLAENHAPEKTYIRFYNGLLDEYAIWNGELQPHQIAELASFIPPQGDIDFDITTDIDDLAGLASDWLENTIIPVQSDVVLEDIENYASGQISFAENWIPDTENPGYGNAELSVLTDPNIPSHGQIMQIDYDFSEDKTFCRIDILLSESGVNLAFYDQIKFTIKKSAGCDLTNFIMDYFDGRDNEGVTKAEMYSKGRTFINVADIVQDEWITVTGDIPNDYNKETCNDLALLQFFIQRGVEDIGTFYVDSITLVDSSENCIPVVGQVVPDFNGDCSVNMIDFADIAGGWLDAN